MDDINEYWKMMDYPPVFTNIDWNESPQGQQQGQSNFIPMEYDQQKVPPSYQHQPFQRRRSSSVDLPINPLYSNTNRFMSNNNMNSEPTIHEEEFIMPLPTTTNTSSSNTTRMNRIGSSATLEFPGNFTSSHHSNNHDINSHSFINTTINPNTNNAESPLSTASSDNNVMSPPPSSQQSQPSEQQTITFFPELHRTSYNTILGKQLKQHQKRRRSSSLPPAFQHQNKHNKQHVPTPLIFTQIQVTDPTPVHHTQKAAKVDTRPVAIERVHKKKAPVDPVTCDPIQTQRKLDEQLKNLNFEDVTVAELKEMLRERGLPATGKKAVLTDRLKEARDLLVQGSSTHAWLSTPKPPAATSTTSTAEISASPNIQGLANMTIHSPAPPSTKSLFMPMEEVKQENGTDCPLFHDLNQSVHPGVIPVNKESSVSPIQPLENNYQFGNILTTTDHSNNNQELDINDLFNFDTDGILDDSILFPTTWDNNHNSNNHNNTSATAEWDQDKLDFFLKELV